MALGKCGDLLQFCAAPNPSAGIVRRAEDHHPGMGGQGGGMAGMPGLPDMSPGGLPPDLANLLNKKK